MLRWRQWLEKGSEKGGREPKQMGRSPSFRSASRGAGQRISGDPRGHGSLGDDSSRGFTSGGRHGGTVCTTGVWGQRTGGDFADSFNCLASPIGSAPPPRGRGRRWWGAYR